MSSPHFAVSAVSALLEVLFLVNILPFFEISSGSRIFFGFLSGYFLFDFYGCFF